VQGVIDGKDRHHHHHRQPHDLGRVGEDHGYLEARAALAERNGLRHTAKFWRDTIASLPMEIEDE
jgi:hypothetical protein